jgi:hypothetical protein
MATRPVLRCYACRTSILDALTSLAGVSIASKRLALPRTHAPTSTRQLHTTSRRLQSIEAEKANTPREPTYEDASTPPTAQDASQPPTDESSDLPWYLTIDDPLPPLPTSATFSTLQTRQEIPPLPPNPPPLLSPLLEHLSIQTGLDDLVLLDLRSVHPPPALGANLLMIIGTARSVKHLNVSADRFCRWLRSTYKLRPYADGLLGRNELKLKLRRKARRLQLARTAGRADEASVDDGITTGWVCVNVGPVDDVTVGEEAVVADPGKGTDRIGTDEEEYQNPDFGDDDADADAADDHHATEGTDLPSSDTPADPATQPSTTSTDSYIGFGSRTASQRIVVQMFTAEKRAEMNLEELWDVRNTRRQVKADKAESRLRWEKQQDELREWEGMSGVERDTHWPAREEWADLFSNIKKQR